MLAKAGVPLTTVQRLMRHSTPLLTAKLYIDVDPFDMMQALEQLPEFCPVIPSSLKNSANDSV
jgi:integrase